MSNIMKTVKPRLGLAVLFCLPVLAAVCALALCLLPEVDAREDRVKVEESRDRIGFLNTALSLSNYADGEYFVPDDAAVNMVQQYQFTGTSSGTIFLLNSGGQILASRSSSDTAFYQISQNRVFIRWFGGNAYFVYSEYAVLAQKFRVEVYDIDHLDGAAAAQGSIGEGFEGAPQSDAELSSGLLDKAGVLRIYRAKNAAGLEEYFVQLAIDGEPDMFIEPVYTDSATPAARGILGVAIAVLLALFWLLLPFWVYLDACRRNMKPDAWVVATLATNAAGFAVYLLVQRRRDQKHAVVPCPACGRDALRGRPHCPWCGALILRSCPQCGMPMEQEWVHCPLCKTGEAAGPVRTGLAAESISVPPPVPAIIDAGPEPEEPADEGGFNFPFMG